MVGEDLIDKSIMIRTKNSDQHWGGREHCPLKLAS